MISSNKETDELEVSIAVVTPIIKVNQPIKQVDGKIQKTTLIYIPFIFNLTTSENLFILTIGFIFGLTFRLKSKEKQ